ncbi:hypothetical protein QKU48_gp0057 [Fadolivirus algeromassiliense]|jgi:hypothetical protein|uniref:Uncharacterized protein n=1 Tax=Fadolivirus FV1/VV64 TaxID=3070911 RepID=A0A7D3V550_9VIRU|nr:hypothetical protein QKU48_gp0057 [Fadolivirus algeromassiliense]QKF93515.1 hypothetical protein Fadolivirus_1_57 [Fadolivirus FV1/VV64]
MSKQDVRYVSSKKAVNRDNGHFVKIAYAGGNIGFCISRKAVEYMANKGSNEANLLLESTRKTTSSLGSAYSGDAYWYPISIHNFDEYSQYFYKNRDDPLLIEAIEQLKNSSYCNGSDVMIAEVKLLKNEKWIVKYNTDSAMAWDIDDEHVEIVDAN